MPSLVDTLRENLDADTNQRFAQHLGADENQVRQGMGQALPLIVAGLSRRAEDDPETVDREATEQDSLLQQMLSGGQMDATTSRPLTNLLRADGPDGLASLASSILGSQSQPIVDGLSRATGLQRNQTAQIVSALAPMVLSALNRKQQREDLSAQDLPVVLRHERQQLEAEVDAPRANGLLGFLDADGDGQVADDLVRSGLQMGVRRLFG